jgi:hypothetical protein
MKYLTAIAIIVALGALSPSLVWAQSGASQDQGMQTQDPSAQAMPQDPSAQGGSSSVNVQGTASSVDQDSKMLTVKDSASGSDRTFRVSQEDQLQDLKPGDQVNVTPSPDDPSKADNVQKQ